LVSNIAFLYLTAFSKTGGIEQFNKNVIASFNQLKIKSDIISVYDKVSCDKYTDPFNFKGFGGSKLKFLLSIFLIATKYEVFIIGHINLALPVFIIKLLNPNATVILMAHGVEVWHEQKSFANWLLKKANYIFAVSRYTQLKLLENNPEIEKGKIKILPNSVDPYFNYPVQFIKPDYLLKRYNLNENDKVLVTIARLSFEEQYKGYDIVLDSIRKIIDQGCLVKYLIVGKADHLEFERVNNLIIENQLSDHVILTGFISSNELIDHYLLADIFVLPSTGEGFGIVLIEALACGLKVIAGNKDGSVDALLNGKLGTLIDPTNLVELKDSIINSLKVIPQSNVIQQEMKQYFSFPIFMQNINRLLTDLKIL